MSIFVSASSSSNNNNEEEVVGLNNVNRHRNNVTYNTRPVRSSSVPNITQISPKRRRSFGAKIGSKMWSLLRRGSSSSSSASRARARSLATNDDSYDVEYEDNFDNNDDGNHDPSNYDGNTGYNSQNGSPFTTPELRGMVTPPQSPSSSHHFKEQENFSLATPPQSPTKQRLSLYSLLKRSKSNSSVGGKSYITSNGSSNGNTTKAPPHTIRFMDNFYILDPNSTAILADALISNRNTSNARKILNSIGKFCSKTNIYKVFDCGIPRNTEEEDDVCPEKMKQLLNANEYNKQNILQASHNGNHLGPSWNILFKVTSDIADWLYYFGPYFTNDANISINHESNNYRNNFVKYPHKQHAIVLLGSSTVVMHTIATAYYLRMSNDPSVEESMRYALGVMKQNTRVTPIRRLKSPKRKKNKSKSNSNNTNNINKVSNGRTSNGQKMVDYVKQKLGIYSKFDKAEFLKKSRLLGDLLYAHKQERLLINMNNNSTNYVGDKNIVKYNSNNNNNNNNNKKQAWIENVNNAAPSPGTAMNMLQRSNLKSGSDDDGEEDSDTNNKKRQMLLSALPPKSRMKLRTILLHSIPHVTVTGCRPYVMIMNSKNELLFTSMIGGVRNATWLDNVISFHPNIEVDSEFQIRIYHLPNGRPGVRLFDAILRTSSCCDFKRPTNSVDSDESEDEYGSYDNDSIPLDEEDIVGHHRDIVKEHSDWGEEEKQKEIATRNTDVDVRDRIITLKRSDLNLVDEMNSCIGEFFRVSIVLSNIAKEIVIVEDDEIETESGIIDKKKDGKKKANALTTRRANNTIQNAIENALKSRNFDSPPYLKCMNIECGHMIQIEPNPSDNEDDNLFHKNNQSSNKTTQIVVCPECCKGTYLPNIAEPTKKACERRFVTSSKPRHLLGNDEDEMYDEEEDEFGDGYMYADGRLPTYNMNNNSEQEGGRNTADIVVGDRITALWKEGTQRSFPGYYPGVIVRINQQDRTFAVLYDDGYMDREVKRSSIKVEGLDDGDDDGDDDGAGDNENGNVGNNTDQNNNVTFSQPPPPPPLRPPPPPRRYSRQSSMNNNSNGNDEERTQWMSLLTEMFPSHDIFTLCKWIDHGLSSNMTLDQVVEDIVNDRILPQSAMLNENMNGDGNDNGENNMYYNTSMSARLCMQTPFGEGRVERETVYEGNKFYVLKLSWGRAYINEKEVRNTRISLSPPPEIYQNFNNNNSSSNQSTARPNRSLPPPPLFAAIGNVSNNNTRLSPPQLNVERERQISADEEFARQLQNSFANANNLEMTLDDVNDMSEEALIELVLGESSTNNRNNNTNNTIEERYQSFMNNRPGNVGRDGRPRGIPAPLLMNRVSGGRIGRTRNNNSLNVHNRSSSNNNSSGSNNISSNFRRKLGGASVSEITRLPKFVYVPSAKHTGTSKSCTVCMEDYKEGDSLRTLPCLHQFHANCIDEWLGYKSSCPVCKASITDC